METQTRGGAMNRVFLIISGVVLAAGNCGGPLIMRLYFIHGGKRIWFSSWLETGGWPVLLVPLAAAYARRRRSAGRRILLMKPPVFAAAAGIGVLTGLDDYLYAAGVSRLPISTAALVAASHLAFTAGSAFLLVGQRFTAYSVNAVVLLSVGAAVLGFHTGGDRPAGESGKDYVLGFFMALSAAAMYGLILPLIELTYKKARQAVTFTVALEIQVVMCFFATVFCTVGMIVNDDFQAIAREGKVYKLGEKNYYLVVVGSAIIWQCFFLGIIGVIFYSSSLLSGILITALLPVTEILAVIFYRENFQAEKALSLFLSLWGFASYSYGELRNHSHKVVLDENIRNEEQTTHVPIQAPAAP